MHTSQSTMHSGYEASPSITSGLTITETAKAVGITIRALRYYEEVGLISPSRTTGNARRYSCAMIERIRRIVGLRLAGAQVAAIRDVINIDDPQLAVDRLALIVQDRCASLRAELEKLEAFAAEIDASHSDQALFKVSERRA